jgi:arabinogalactan oligomer/maltooligosaccharide transport system substrate-binding protein
MFGDGTDASKGITFGGDAGAAVTTYIANAIASGKLIDDANGAGLDGLRNGNVVAMFSGTWDAKGVAEALGENYAAAALPTITIGGEQKQMKSFSGSKALGVNPNSKNPAAAVALAAFLGSAEMQALHYELRDGGVVPCDTTLLKDPKFSSNPAAVAQDATIAGTSVLQPSIPAMGEYWSNAESLGKALANKEITLDGVADAVEKWNNAINGAGSL